MTDCHWDFEWRSDVDIKRGPERYFGTPRSQPLMASYAFTGGDVRRWTPEAPCPPDVVAHAANGGRFVAHNAANFERHAWRVMVRDYGWPELRLEQWRDTMAAALAMALPADLETLALALNLPEQKDKDGKALIKFFCIPRADGEFNDPANPEHRDKFLRFQDYCDQDVRTEMAVDARLVPLSADEQSAWVLCQRINDRGIRVDRPSAFRALALADRAKACADADIGAATGGEVKKHTAVADLTRWVASRGVPLDGVAKNDLLEALDLDDLPDDVRRVLEIRQAAAKTSTSKLVKMLSFSEGSGRIRHRYRYHGTSPGRWCLAEGSLIDVKTPSGAVTQKPIERVQQDDLVWDGDAWAAHEGVVFSGEKNVIEHDGVVASREHIVYVDDHRKMPLWRAKILGLSIYERKPKI